MPQQLPLSYQSQHMTNATNMYGPPPTYSNFSPQASYSDMEMKPFSPRKNDPDNNHFNFQRFYGPVSHRR